MNLYNKVILVVLVGVPLFLSSCSSDETSWDKNRGVKCIMAIVNDSLALLATTRCYSSEKINFAGTTGNYGCTHDGLHLVNYRKKQPTFWSDTLNDSFYSVSGTYITYEGQLNDSVVYSWDKQQIGYWKIGSKPVFKKQKSESHSCSGGSFSGEIRTWKDDSFLIPRPIRKKPLPGGDTCQYALFNIGTGHIEYSRFSGELSWLAEAECEDMRYMSGQMVCLKKNFGNKCAIDLLVGGEIKSTVVVEYCENDSWNIEEITWHGNYVNVKMWKNSSRINKIYKVNSLELVFDSFYPDIYWQYSNYYDKCVINGLDTIKYGAEDLL